MVSVVKIVEWENRVCSKYTVNKIDNLNELKFYLSDPFEYADCFSIESITEGEFVSEEFYAAYAFNEHEISGRDIIATRNSGWTTTIIFISSDNGIDIKNWFMHSSAGLKDNEIVNFWIDSGLYDINDKKH